MPKLCGALFYNKMIEKWDKGMGKGRESLIPYGQGPMLYIQ